MAGLRELKSVSARMDTALAATPAVAGGTAWGLNRASAAPFASDFSGSQLNTQHWADQTTAMSPSRRGCNGTLRIGSVKVWQR